MKRRLISILAILIIWEMASVAINKSVLLPSPLAVLEKMAELIGSPSFYVSLMATLYRVAIAFICALAIGSVLGLIAGYNKNVREYLDPLIKIFQTVPQVSYILIIIVWFSSFTSLLLIILMMTLPIFYYNMLNGYLAIESEYLDVARLFGSSRFSNLHLVVIPLLKSNFLAAINSALPLSIKIAVMAEIFISSSKGVGSLLYLARINLDMASILALTIWMIIIIAIPTNLIGYCMDRN
ncbi:MAG: ABC transporter permease subunit [Erysipelotrichaceae bacterium]|nr:ABC transporter permease subunit [Erysipelotrichaceae bacterium]